MNVNAGELHAGVQEGLTDAIKGCCGCLHDKDKVGWPITDPHGDGGGEPGQPLGERGNWENRKKKPDAPGIAVQKKKGDRGRE